jgi:hypothetical protein
LARLGKPEHNRAAVIASIIPCSEQHVRAIIRRLGLAKKRT